MDPATPTLRLVDIVSLAVPFVCFLFISQCIGYFFLPEPNLFFITSIISLASCTIIFSLWGIIAVQKEQLAEQKMTKVLVAKADLHMLNSFQFLVEQQKQLVEAIERIEYPVKTVAWQGDVLLRKMEVPDGQRPFVPDRNIKNSFWR
ncbi:hypothetical protein B0T20DRAFT_391170 [Sordaria brevicollis]|uniref:Uncharacterized protein n=1 Tax=Sordaria brevicollis TaxID=83679 RepID=A0AAE0UDC1_SORBR|nr:hypothetical protein B0T20DRAFT_391170 [Sordaria brevicollis]